MSELYTKIANFYGGDAFLKATYSDICFLACNISRSLVDGSAIEVKSFDGYVSKRQMLSPVSRLDTIVCLARICALLETRLNSMPQTEINELDRVQKVLSGAPNDLNP